MDWKYWITILGFVLFLGFGISVWLCISAIKKQEDIIIASRLHHRMSGYEIIMANVGLVFAVIMIAYKHYIFLPAVICMVLFIILQTKIQSGITEDGALIDTTFLDWEFMKSYKLVYDENDGSTIILKIRANRKQYVLVCDREDKKKIEEIFNGNHVKVTKTINDKD
ncbi:MAG: hypothetical protein J6P57_06365 [Lachnospiraceae bacterium]|nr:hypothetical protein [Lachnospiraceae bacterium]